MKWLQTNPEPQGYKDTALNIAKTTGRVGIGLSFLTVGMFTIAGQLGQMNQALGMVRGKDTISFKKTG